MWSKAKELSPNIRWSFSVVVGKMYSRGGSLVPFFPLLLMLEYEYISKPYAINKIEWYSTNQSVTSNK